MLQGIDRRVLNPFLFGVQYISGKPQYWFQEWLSVALIIYAEKHPAEIWDRTRNQRQECIINAWVYVE